MMKHEQLTEKVIGAFYEVYNQLGYGFQEKVYETAMVLTLEKLGIPVKAQAVVPVMFKGVLVGECFPDLIVADLLVVELKAVPEIVEAHKAQTMGYLKATGLEVGLILNFGPKPEVKRVILDEKGKEARLRSPMPL